MTIVSRISLRPTTAAILKREVDEFQRQRELETYFPEKIPATEDTRERLPLELRHFYRARHLSELAALCLINAALRQPRREARKCWSKGALTKEQHEELKRSGIGRPRLI
jgi:hypothetical protein